jgi:acylphosphatase
VLTCSYVFVVAFCSSASVAPNVVCYSMILERVDGQLASLSGHGGFRKYCKASADALGVTGYVQGVLGRDMAILFEGESDQCRVFFNFLKTCRSQGMVAEFKEVTRTYRDDTYYDKFSILVSHSRRCTRGRYSDAEYDKRSEYSYGEARDAVATPDGGDDF